MPHRQVPTGCLSLFLAPPLTLKRTTLPRIELATIADGMASQQGFSQPSPLKVLSLDGGGVRGLSSLIVLKYLMKRVNPQHPPKPCDYFDLIGGTSTGGIIALMLGRLRMDVDTCINKYLELFEAAFQLKRSKVNLFGKAKDQWKTDGAYRSECLVTEFQKMAEKVEDNKNAKLLHADTACRVFVCAFTKAFNTPVRLRTYSTNDAVDTLDGSVCTIWEAARATSAAATFFDPIQIGMQKYVDGATGFNNPIEAVLEEATSIWPDAMSRLQCIVSVGTGVPELTDFGDNLMEVAMTLKAIATETENTEMRFFKSLAHLGIRDIYFRFNVNRGLGGIGLDEHEKKDKIVATTELYLGDARIREVVAAFTTARAPHHSYVDANMKDSYLKWLPYIDPLPYHNKARQYRTTKSTGEWFLGGHFQQWKINSQSFLWLHGKAGCGKTVLSSAIIDRIQEQNLGSLAYFYFSFQSKEFQDIRHFKYAILTQVLRNLVKEDPLLRGRFYVPRAFRQLYDTYQPSKDPKVEDLDATFLDVVNESNEIYIVVDALDECPVEDRRSVVLFLSELSQKSQSGIHILITSRLEDDIETVVKKIPKMRSIVPVSTAEVDIDIRNHLNDRMAEDTYKHWSESLKNDVVDRLTRLAQGVFRWADLQVRELQRKVRPKDVKKALQKLPKTLEETYERMLTRIDEDEYLAEAIAVLRWLAYSRRPLLLSEVAEIATFNITEDRSHLDADGYSVSFAMEDRFPSSLWVRRILSGLVTVSWVDDYTVPSEADKTDTGHNQDGINSRSTISSVVEETLMGHDTDRIISFAHFSVKEYLESANIFPPYLPLEATSGERFILKSSLAYIKFYDTRLPSGPDSFEKYPLLQYACKYWPYHARRLLSGIDRDWIQTTLNMLISTRGRAFLQSIIVATNRPPQPQSTERFCAYHNIDSCVHDLLENAEYGSHKTQMRIHFEHNWLGDDSGDNDVVLYLVEIPRYKSHQEQMGVDFDKAKSISQAAGSGDKDLVQLLLDSGVDVHAWAPDSTDLIGTALHRAAGEGHIAVVNLLLGRGADIDAKGFRDLMSWEYFSFTGPHSLADLFGWTPLHSAAEYGHVAVVRCLLDNGAKIDAEYEEIEFNGVAVTALSLAELNEHSAVAKLLSEMGANHQEADSNSPVRARGLTALQIAARKGHIEVVRLLVEMGAEINRLGVTTEAWLE